MRDLVSRRAIEALRSGVPSEAAVEALGCDHPQIEQRFEELLDRCADSMGVGRQPRGLLISGDFGSGKSHLLHHLEHLALQRNFACSRLVISKGTSLADPAKLYAAAAAAVRIQGPLEAGLRTIADKLRFQVTRYTDFYRWTNGAAEDGTISMFFPASLYAFEYGRDQEMRDKLARFWAGEPLRATDLKGTLRQLGQLPNYPLGRAPTVRELPWQRLRFATRLIHAAGFEGWIILFDEAELIGQYSFKQRANAYANLARLLGTLADTTAENVPGLAAVFAWVASFEKAVLDDRRDEEAIPGRLEASGRDEDRNLAAAAKLGMRAIRRERVPLESLTQQHVSETRFRICELHAKAFDWQPPEIDGPIDASTVIRRHIRRWIAELDFRRLQPGEAFDVVEQSLREETFAEDPDIEGTDEDTADANDATQR